MNTPASVPAHIECVRGIPVLVITGRLDAINAPLFDAQAVPLLAEARSRVLLDFSGLKYIGSAGLRSIIRIIEHTAVCGGRTGIFALSPQILVLIENSRWYTLPDIFPRPLTPLNQNPS